MNRIKHLPIILVTIFYISQYPNINDRFRLLLASCIIWKLCVTFTKQSHPKRNCCVIDFIKQIRYKLMLPVKHRAEVWLEIYILLNLMWSSSSELLCVVLVRHSDVCHNVGVSCRTHHPSLKVLRYSARRVTPLAQYVVLSSQPVALRFVLIAVSKNTEEPAVGSSTNSPGTVHRRMISAARSEGFSVG